jgi:hypothetical protein
MARSRSTSPLGVAVVAALLLTSLVPASAGAAPIEDPPGDCLPTLATSQLQAGDLGTGWTVSRGRDPAPFSIEVLGVVTDGVAPGRDLIIVDTSGPAIDAIGGIWSGMSGSPVLVERDGDAHLIGAVAYGFSLGPNKVAGLTPAADLVSLSDRGVGGLAASADVPDEVALDTQARQAIAAETGVAMSRVGSSMQRLPVPLSLSTHPDRAPALVEQLRDRPGLSNLLPYAAGASAGAGLASSGDIAPGDNFAGVLSTGDLTAAGIGTTSYVCDGRAVAFGHPFLATGASTMSAHAADALTVIADPTLGPYKMANVAEHVGTIDQDRLAGIRAQLGVPTPSTPVTSTVVELDDGGHRDGQTDVQYTPFLSDLALFHVLYNIDTVFDRIGGGSSLVTSRTQGTRDGGAPWSVEVGNRHASGFDIAFESLFDLYFDVLQLDTNDAEAVRITGVDVDVDVEATERTYQIRRVLVRDPGGSYVPLAEATLQGGRTEKLRIVLREVDRRDGKLATTPTEIPLDLDLVVPRDVHGFAILEVVAGPGDFDEDPYECLFDEAGCPANDDLTFDDVLASIESRPRNDDLVARLLPIDDGWDDDWDDERFDEFPSLAPLAETRHRLDRVGVGSVTAEVYIEPLPTSKPAFVRGNRWRFRNTLSEGPSEFSFRFGKATDVKLLCDWTGNGATPVVFRDGTWYARSEMGAGPADVTFRFGKAGDVPVCGDWNGNGKDSPGLVRGKTWMLRNRMSGGKPLHEFTYGKASDAKVVGDWNGNGIDTPGVRRGNEWRLRNRLASGRPTIVFEFGHAKAQPVVGDWNFNGRDSVGVVRMGTWRLRNQLSAGKAGIRFQFGGPGDVFLSWD